MFGSSGGGGGVSGGGGGGNPKRGKGGGGNASRNNHNHQAPQEIIHQMQPVPVMAPNQPITHIQPIFQTFHQPGMPQLYAPIQFHYMPTGSIHPGFPNLGAAPQTQYVFPRAPYTSSVPVNLQTLGAFSAIPQNLTQNHTPNQMTALRNSHGPLAIPSGAPNILHTAPPPTTPTSSSSSTTTTYKKRAHALDIIDPETRKNILEPWNSPEEVKKDKDKVAVVVVDKDKEEKKKSEPSASDDSANKVDCQMQTDVPAKITKQPAVKSEEKEKTSQENGKYF